MKVYSNYGLVVSSDKDEHDDTLSEEVLSVKTDHGGHVELYYDQFDELVKIVKLVYPHWFD
jgi:hypothetical protein